MTMNNCYYFTRKLFYWLINTQNIGILLFTIRCHNSFYIPIVYWII